MQRIHGFGVWSRREFIGWHRPVMDGPALRPKKASTAASSASTPSTFLFVDYQDQSSQSHAVAQRKQAFLKRKHHRSRKEERLRSLKASIGPLPTQTPGPTRTAANGDTQGAPAAGRIVARAWSLDRPLWSGTPDPFSSLATTMTADMDLYFNHYQAHCSRSIWPFGATALSIWWWQQAWGQPALLHILLSTSAIHRAGRGLIDRSPSRSDRKAVQDSLHFRTVTIRKLQSLVQDPTAAFLESTAVTIAHLICVEAADANLNAVDWHLNGLAKIINSVGGLDAWNHATISIFYCADFMRGALKGCPPAFPMSVIWRGEVLDSLNILDSKRQSVMSSSIGSHFFDSLWSKKLHPSLRSIIRLLRVIVYYQQGSQKETPVLNDILLYAGHLILSAFHECSASDSQESLRLCLLLYAMVCVWTFQGLACVIFIVDALRHRLKRALPLLRRVAPQLSLWMLFMGGLASTDLTSDAWFVARLAEVAEQLSVGGWDKALPVLDGFFVRRPIDRRMMNLWNEVQRQQVLQSPVQSA
ncbi:hypothetical protein BO71DRAFT_480626 [Aspergillus ellipticus CBS 707.79]|uniref:Uncharacterized protein n=1 Tax=Aspergillus ellipticus CBS 707.79 TaxID=1448320 RepID=A0A319DKL1_9EURO|nr:hypothetical protein BO71DRAFT_480626 [Aspergillus ellipticus CBS 707.79]